jgi:hypothetical protein
MSEEIIIAKATNQLNRELKFFLSRLHRPLEHKKSVDLLMTEINDVIIEELQLRIATLLKPLLLPYGIDIGFRFWFSSEDLKKGYVPLYKDKNAFMPTHILFLVEASGDFITMDIYPGKIAKIMEVNHYLHGLPSAGKYHVPVNYARKILNKSNNNQNE